MSSVNLVLKTSDLQTTNLEKVIASNTPVYRNIDPPTIETVLTSTYGLRCLAYDSNGFLYVGGNGFIQKYVDNSLIFFAGNGTSGYSGDGGQASNALIGITTDIKFDSNGNLFFCDFNYHVIRRIDINGIITTITGNGTAGTTQNGIQANTALLNQPHSLIFDQNDNIYFSSYGNKVINKIDTTGIITTIAGTSATSGFTSNTFSTPTQLDFDKNENYLFVADRFNNAIRKVDLNSGVITTVAGNGNNGSSGDGSQATSALLSAPVAVAIDLDGNIIIGEYRKVRKVDLNGVITTIAGTGNSGNTDGKAIDATIGQVYKLLINSIGNIILADLGNNSIRKIIIKEQIQIITLQQPLLWPVNLESLLCHMYDEYDKFQICLQYVAGNVSTTRPQNLNILLSGLPFTLEYKFNSNNRSTITLANIKIDTDTFYQQYSLLQYHTFTSQAIANILINITNMDNDIINETFFNSLIFSFNIIGDPNCKKKISRLL
jgi:hypothetical protein